jgi:Recombinase
MASLLKLRRAARLVGVSPGQLYCAIGDGRLTAVPGGGPGKLTLVSLEAVQTFSQSEGLRVPDEAEMLERPERLERAARSEHSERSIDVHQHLDTLAGQYLARVMERQSNYFDMFLKEEITHLVERVMDRVVERLADQHTGHGKRSMERSISAITNHKAVILTRLQAMQAEGLSLQAIANRLNKEGIPTLSGKGRWQKDTIGNLRAQAEDLQGPTD